MTDLIANFRQPPPGYGQTPFWWWVGDTLDLNRLTWQIDELLKGGVRSAIISYNHWPDGSTNVGDPAVFSEQWWELLNKVLDHAMRSGFTLGMKDYCLLNPMLREIGNKVGIGGWELRVTDDGRADALPLSLPSEGDGPAQAYALPTVFDPMNPKSGRLVIDHFYSRFAERLGSHFGKTFNIFFQDELDFSCRFPLWSPQIEALFENRFGYSIAGQFGMILDRSCDGAQLRVDYAELSAILVEENFFKPIHAWMEVHNCLFGHDNAGRGSPRVGIDHYGDYMRTMRWYSAPGSDDPDLRGPRAFKGIKVASSIAHLNNRPRVWAECFHSSGWGVTPSDMLTGVNTLFVLGANLINYHGLYYTTNLSHWEWAPPDFHFRQPFWSASRALNTYVERLSWLLSQGTHICDVAILFPTAALAGALNDIVAQFGPVSLSESQRAESVKVDSAEALCFRVADQLYHDRVDFDFIDASSLARARFANGHLFVGQARYHTLILADSSAVDGATQDAITAHLDDGGRVIAVGAIAPAIANLMSLEKFDALVPDFAETVSPRSKRSVVVDHPAIRIMERVVDCHHVWCFHNPSDGTVTIEPRFQSLVNPVRLDAFTGTMIAIAPEDDRTTLVLEAGELAVVATNIGEAARAASMRLEPRLIARFADEDWTYRPVPTLDNRFGDYLLDRPGSLLEIRRIAWRDDPSAPWQTIAPGFAPRMRVLGPFARGTEPSGWYDAIAEDVEDAAIANLATADIVWRDCLASAREGLFDDPWAGDWRSGPHGLKTVRLPDWIDLDGDEGDVWYASGWWRTPPPAACGLRISSRAGWELWSSGDLIAKQPDAMPSAVLPVWGLPDLCSSAHTVPLDERLRSGRLFLRLRQGYAGHCRVRLSWIDANGHELADIPTQATAHESRPQQFALSVPPGKTSISIAHNGTLIPTGSVGWMITTSMSEKGNCFKAIRDDERAPSGTLNFAITDPEGRRAGDCLLSSIAIESASGAIKLGDWSSNGLRSYSGGICYRQEIELDANVIGQPIALSLGQVRAAARVTINSQDVGSVFAMPWTIDCGATLVEGRNVFEITVFNTLANHFADASPTGYVFEGQEGSGLFGPVALVAFKPQDEINGPRPLPNDRA